MPSKNKQGRNAPDTAIVSSATALPAQAAGKAPATPLSGAFTAALGARPQMAHAGSRPPGNAKVFLGQGAGDAGAHMAKNTSHGAPTVPRKGHR